MNRIVHFEIQADDLERCATFYREIFGWKIEKWTGMVGMEYWMVMTAELNSTEPGINGGMVKRPAGTAPAECGANAYVCSIVVDNFDTIAEKIINAGGKIAMPKFPINGMAWQGYFLDTEGNTFGLHQADPGAK
ncbi:MAG: glyoxalase [Candidatus Magasanikbacteria bacterium RIFCSPHIGHO2_02_FULL_41_13]|uniref:Glyoxalase n=1 Tax=Candidatus Magasanikbacteria bacterium RIFCSPHIGHO2_02_FULL_41_13 TaxID=1798676 RepID=A0A1F6M4B3_9BACT|nr:MAG: glyoxalase [Candidatus Magasanikbacteria bacterium RIFCSPHIGHO2_02_FULL_41_13]